MWRSAPHWPHRCSAETDTTLYVMELKLDKSPEEALARLKARIV